MLEMGKFPGGLPIVVSCLVSLGSWLCLFWGGLSRTTLEMVFGSDGHFMSTPCEGLGLGVVLRLNNHCFSWVSLLVFVETGVSPNPSPVCF